MNGRQKSPETSLPGTSMRPQAQKSLATLGGYCGQHFHHLHEFSADGRERL